MNVKIIFLFLIVLARSSAEADVLYGREDPAANASIWIVGEIREGDYESFVRAVKNAHSNGELPNLYVQLDTSGGDVVEAMKIGEAVRALRLTTIAVEGECYSACIFILIAGADRISASGIGIHRPYFERKYFGDLRQEQAEAKYALLTSLTRHYMNEMGAPSALIEKMYRVPSNELYKMNLGQVEEWISGTPPALDEWLIAKCGSYTEEEANDYFWWRVGKANWSEGYVQYLKEKISGVDACRRRTLSEERTRALERLLSNAG